MSRFPTAAHLASWAGMCPGNNITGGKRPSGKTNKGNRWLGEVLHECAWAAAHSRKTYLGAQFWHLARRIGKKKAAVAVGHSILVIGWHLLSRGVDYDDLGQDWFTRGTDPERRKTHLIKQLQALGYAVSLRPAARSGQARHRLEAPAEHRNAASEGVSSEPASILHPL